jgi:transposase
MRYTIKQFQAQFSDDNACLQYIFDQRFGAEYTCKKCNKKGQYYKVSNRKSYACSCGEQVNPTAGTIFHKSETKLTLWFFAIFLMSQSKNGVSAKELERHLGVTYKTAWRINKQVRKLMSQKPSMLDGTIEADATYIGGKRRMKQKFDNKTPVLGLVQRKGAVIANTSYGENTFTVIPLVRENVAIGSSIMSDEHAAYKKVLHYGYDHSYIKHIDKEYVRGNIHTNTIEGFWSQMKRSIDGTYHMVSPKYLQSYLDEFVYRYNHRYTPIFPLLLGQMCQLPFSKSL